MRQRLVPHRMVPLLLRVADIEAEGQVVLSELPRRPAERDEEQGTIPEGAGALQQGTRGKDVGSGDGPATCGVICVGGWKKRVIKENAFKSTVFEGVAIQERDFLPSLRVGRPVW